MESLKEFSFFLRKRIKKLILICIAAGFIAGGINHFIMPDYYYTAVKFQTGMQAGEDFIRLLPGRSILEKVIYEARADVTPKELKNMMYLSLIKNTRIIELEIYDYDPREAEAIVNAYMKVIYAEYQGIFDIKTVEAPGMAQALPKEDIVSVVRGMLFAFVISVLIFGTRFARGKKIKMMEDIEENLNLKVLAVIPLWKSKPRKRKKEEVGLEN